MSASSLADIIFFIHILFILGVILPVPLIIAGGIRKWPWIRNLWFRLTHLAMIGFVVAESVFKVHCPLTVWENNLRRQAGQQDNGDSFIAYWLHKLIFHSLPPWVFLCIYAAFGLLVVLLLVLFPPRVKNKSA